MDGKFREMQGEARANSGSGGEEQRSLAREVAALGMLIGQLAEEQRRTLATADGSIRSRLESQLATHVETMQDMAEQMREQHEANGRTIRDLAAWTAMLQERVERLPAVFGSLEAKAGVITGILNAAGQRSAPREERLDRLLEEAARERAEAWDRRRGRTLRMVCLLVLAAVLGGALVVMAPALGLPMISTR